MLVMDRAEITFGATATRCLWDAQIPHVPSRRSGQVLQIHSVTGGAPRWRRGSRRGGLMVTTPPYVRVLGEPVDVIDELLTLWIAGGL
jgi:hypothetical protein